MRSVRYAVVSLAALVVLSLGFALVPAENPAPAQPPFTEVARAAALEDAMDLRAAGMELAAAGTVDAASVDPVVTLLTIQARALLAPAAAGGQAGIGTTAPASASPAATPASGLPKPTPTSAQEGMSGLASALVASGTKRIKDAQEADGGMARLLAGTGTAQLLAAARLAAAAGAPVAPADPGPVAAVPVPAETGPSCPAVPAAESTGPGGTGPEGTGQGGTGPGAALAAALAAEQQAVYGYQAALPRLGAADAGTALTYLGQHDDLLQAAEARLPLVCATAAPQQPGYALDARFLAAPAAGLGRLEAATMAAYGDLVALSQGTVRAWALAALQSAAGRAARWGADPGPVPGLPLDVDRLPGLPSGPAQAPSPTAT
ncbi:ferritin-like domain-containing protein [Arthrobacter sp. MAHUQ-56]|nr:ferritin-like domain-containing protein [Arthrobacter sp. MAHUQ-56]